MLHDVLQVLALFFFCWRRRVIQCNDLPGTLKPSRGLQEKFKISNPAAQLLAKPGQLVEFLAIAAVSVEAGRLHQQCVKILIALPPSG